MTHLVSRPWVLVAPGVWKLSLGAPEAITPLQLHAPASSLSDMARIAEDARPPADTASIACNVRPRGTRVELPIADATHVEQFFGGGLQLSSLNQTGRKRSLRVNSDPLGDAGDSHAPVPFYVSTAGYGIYVDSARYVEFYLGASRRLTEHGEARATGTAASDIAVSTQALYAQRATAGRPILIDVPVAQGVDIYWFAGPTPLDVVRRYNLFAGGGCLPPMWGLGIWYRMYGRSGGADAIALAEWLRTRNLPCDVFGLEPGWQSQAYSCSFTWNPTLFPEPQQMIDRLRGLGYKLNLWEHAFVHPTSPMYAGLKPLSGDFEVWNGLVPDLAMPDAYRQFSDFHRKELVEKGISGFKLDECDSSDFIKNGSWSFPDAAAFPSGMDGEQMHTQLGLLYQRAILEACESAGERTYSAVRSSGPMAAPLPFVLYSDLYDHRDFVRGIPSSSFCGLLWTPEVRNASSQEELIRRIQSVVLSPQALINAWYIKNPPWLQFDLEKNNADVLLEDATQLEQKVRELFELRMSLIPYLYTAFAKYKFDGIPPFRALVLDYPDDPKFYSVDDQYMMGDDLLIAPIFAGQAERTVYLPAGTWHEFQTGKALAGRQDHVFPVAANSLLIFVRSGTSLPLAKPVQFVSPTTVFDITIRQYGPANALRSSVLYEDDGTSLGYLRGHYNWVSVAADHSIDREGSWTGERYQFNAWTSVSDAAH